jgi:sulfoxide reductase heme-binding subunit YedZ
MTDVKFNKILISVNALIPLALLAYDGFRGQLGANPVEFFIRTTGVLTLTCVLVTLAVTPLRELLNWNEAIKYRRMVGLYAFFYGCLHLSSYIVFDRGLSLSATVADVIQRPFITIGMAAYLMMVPLAITSTNGMVKRLGGKRWQRLHRMIYLIGALGVIHFYMLVKSDVFYPVIFAILVSALLLYRVYARQQKKVVKQAVAR